MKKCRITVLKAGFEKDLADRYAVKDLGPCKIHKEGQTYLTDFRKPEGFCDEAWKAIHHFVFAMAHGADASPLFYGDWMAEPGVAVVCCNDGLRPVFFKIEATDIEAIRGT